MSTQSTEKSEAAVLQFRPRPRRIEVRLTAIAGLYPYGGVTRAYQMTERGLSRLIAAAEWLERAS